MLCGRRDFPELKQTRTVGAAVDGFDMSGISEAATRTSDEDFDGNDAEPWQRKERNESSQVAQPIDDPGLLGQFDGNLEDAEAAVAVSKRRVDCDRASNAREVISCCWHRRI